MAVSFAALMTDNLIFMRSGIIFLIYTAHWVLMSSFPEYSANPDRLGANSINTPYGSILRTMPVTVHPIPN